MSSLQNRITSRCPHCASTFEVPNAVIGKHTRCTNCGQRFELEEYSAPSFDNQEDFNGCATESINAEQLNKAYSSPHLPPSPPPFVPEFKSVGNGRSVSRSTHQQSRHGSLRFLPLRVVCTLLDVLASLMLLGVLIEFAESLYSVNLIRDASGGEIGEFIFATVAKLIIGITMVASVLVFTQLARLLIHIEKNTFHSLAAQEGIQNDLLKVLDALNNRPQEERE